MTQPPTDTPHSTEHASGEHIRQSRLETADTWRTKGVNPYPYKFEKSHTNAELQSSYGHLENGQETEDTVSVAGRIMAIRNSGM